MKALAILIAYTFSADANPFQTGLPHILQNQRTSDLKSNIETKLEPNCLNCSQIGSESNSLSLEEGSTRSHELSPKIGSSIDKIVHGALFRSIQVASDHLNNMTNEVSNRVGQANDSDLDILFQDFLNSFVTIQNKAKQSVKLFVQSPLFHEHIIPPETARDAIQRSFKSSNTNSSHLQSHFFNRDNNEVRVFLYNNV